MPITLLNKCEVEILNELQGALTGMARLFHRLGYDLNQPYPEKYREWERRAVDFAAEIGKFVATGIVNEVLAGRVSVTKEESE